MAMNILDALNAALTRTKDYMDAGLAGKAPASHGTHLTLGTGSSNAFRGDYGNTAYNHSQAAHAPSNAQKNSDITKAEIEAKLTGVITSHDHGTSTMQESTLNNLIDEVFQEANSGGRQVIADAIGNPLKPEDSLNAMANKIDNIGKALSKYIVSYKGVVTGEEGLGDLLNILIQLPI